MAAAIMPADLVVCHVDGDGGSFAGRVDDIGLNCADANTGARQLYLEMGFDQHIPYEECGLGPARSTD